MIALVSLTKKGNSVAVEISDKADFKVDIYSKPFNKSFKDTIKDIFNEYEQIIFIMATGIVVRTIAPLLKHKSKDPGIIVIDEKKNNVISLLSGHLGGANELTIKISLLLNSNPVITTASDINNLLSVDMLAKKYNLSSTDYNAMKEVTSVLIETKKILLKSEIKIEEDGYFRNIKDYCGVLEISNKVNSFNTNSPYVKLINKNLVLGIGCKKNTEYKKLFRITNDFLKRNGYLIEAISHLASAWVKKEEAAIIKLKDKLNIEYNTYELEEIKDVENLFDTSDFVRKTIGVGCVSEPCGYLGSKNGKCLVKLEKLDGITLSLWEMKG